MNGGTMKRLIIPALMATLGCFAMEKPESTYDRLEKARKDYFDALKNTNRPDLEKELIIAKKLSTNWLLIDQNNKSMLLTINDHLALKKCKTYDELIDECNGIIDFSHANTQYAKLTAEQHKALTQCKTYDELIHQRNNIVDKSSAKINISPFINENFIALIEVLEEIQNVEKITPEHAAQALLIADYLQAPEDTITALAERCESIKDQYKDDTHLQKLITNNAYYQNLCDFLNDRHYKMHKEKIVHTEEYCNLYCHKICECPGCHPNEDELAKQLKKEFCNWDFSHQHLASLGFYKKLKSIEGYQKMKCTHQPYPPFQIQFFGSRTY
jgi:hypothetical protein